MNILGLARHGLNDFEQIVVLGGGIVWAFLRTRKPPNSLAADEPAH
jgi:hypothetical protein